MAKKETKQEQPVFAIKGMKVANVRRISEKVVAFSLLGNGLGLYNLKVIDGKKGKFVAAPQEKGKDDKYYNVYAVYFSEDDEQQIIEAVMKKCPDEKPADEDTLF